MNKPAQSAVPGAIFSRREAAEDGGWSMVSANNTQRGDYPNINGTNSPFFD